MPPGVPGAKAWVRRCGPARTRAGDAGARGCGSSRHAIWWHTRAYCVPPVLCARRARDLVARPVVKRGPHTGEGAPTQRDVSAYAVCGCSGGGGAVTGSRGAPLQRRHATPPGGPPNREGGRQAPCACWVATPRCNRAAFRQHVGHPELCRRHRAPGVRHEIQPLAFGCNAWRDITRP